MLRSIISKRSSFRLLRYLFALFREIFLKCPRIVTNQLVIVSNFRIARTILWHLSFTIRSKQRWWWHGKLAVLDISENGRQIAEKLLILLNDTQRQELAEYILDQPVSSVKPMCCACPHITRICRPTSNGDSRRRAVLLPGITQSLCWRYRGRIDGKRIWRTALAYIKPESDIDLWNPCLSDMGWRIYRYYSKDDP